MSAESTHLSTFSAKIEAEIQSTSIHYIMSPSWLTVWLSVNALVANKLLYARPG